MGDIALTYDHFAVILLEQHIDGSVFSGADKTLQVNRDVPARLRWSRYDW